MKNLQWFITIGDTSGVGTIWTCCVICLAHLTALCHLVSQVDPALGASMNSLYELTLDKLGNVSLETRIEEYSQFDVLTGVRLSPRLFPSSEMGRSPSYSTRLDVLENCVGYH